MEFKDGFCSYAILTSQAIKPHGYKKISSQYCGYGSLARKLILRADSNPVFQQSLDSICRKTEDLLNPYDTDLEEAYAKELTFRLSAHEIWYKQDSSPSFSSFFEEEHKPPWYSSGGGYGGTTEASQSGEVEHEEESIRSYMEQARRIGRAKPKTSTGTSTSTKKHSKEESLNPKTEWLELNLYYADQHQTPVFNQAIELKLADGSIKKESVNDKGFLRLDGLPKGNTVVTLKEDTAKRRELNKLREQLAQTLDELVSEAELQSNLSDSVLSEMNAAEEGLVYIGAFLMGGVDMVTDLWAFAKIVGQGLVKLNMAYLDLLEDFFRGDAREIQRKLEAARKEGSGAYEAASEVSEAIYLLTTDQETWEILTGFVEDYWDASSGVDLTRATAPLIIEIAITILTSGAGAPVLAANLGKASKLTEKASDLVSEIIKLKKALGQKSVKQTSTGNRLLIPVDNSFKSSKSTTPDFSTARRKSDPPPIKSTSKYPNAKTIELDDKGRFIDKHGKARTNGGPNAPEFAKWQAKGGIAKYDEATDTVIYVMPEMKTAKWGTKDVEVAYKAGPPDGQRYPDFSDYSSESVNIPDMTGLSENDITPPEVGDFSKAWDQLEKEHGSQYIEDKYGIKKRIKGKRIGTWPDKSPRGYTWHHHGDKSTMQMVDYEIHKTFTHSGGASASR